MLYNMYFSKKDGKIEISKLRNVFASYINSINEIPYKYNDCYYFCSDKKALIELGNKLKQEWIAEVEKELFKLKAINVKSRGC